jgi:DNA-binding NtrC family response regulator/tetratricopeptide (TPR) repeat protein
VEVEANPMKRETEGMAGYRIGGVLGSTPRGATHFAAGPTARSRGIIKLLPGAGHGPIAPLLRPDFADLASLGHPTLALPVAAGRDPRTGRPFILRPYIPGSEIVRAVEGRLPREIAPLLAAAAEALAILHRSGIAHRNVRPSNLIVPGAVLGSPRAKEPRVVLCDPAWWPEGKEPGGDGEIPPIVESAGEGASPIAADLRALGRIFERLLAGKGPGAARKSSAEEIGELPAGVPVDLARVVLALLRPGAGPRYADAGQLLEDLRRLPGGRGSMRPVPPECFVGRKDELDRVRARLGEQERGGGYRRQLRFAQRRGSVPAPAAIAVTGEAGAGKSAFLRRLALEAQLLGHRTVSIRCHGGSGAPAAALRSLLEVLAPGSGGRAIRARFRALVEGEGKGARRDEPEAGSRGRLAREIAGLLAEAAGSRPTLLVADDVHLADDVSVECLASIAAAIGSRWGRSDGKGGRPPSLAVSFRAESPFRPAVAPLVEALGRPGHGHLVLELPPLGPDAVGGWVERALGGIPRIRAARESVAALRGHPFSIREALRVGPERPWEDPAAGKALPALHVEYLASLPKMARDLLKVLAVLGRPARADLLETILGCARGNARAALESLARDGTLIEEEEAHSFRHGSFQGWLLGAMKGSERRALHGRIARALSGIGRGVGRPPAEEIARHWLSSATPAKGIPAALVAARRLVRDPDRKALGLFRAVLDILPRSDARWEAAAREAAEAHARAGEHRRAVAILEEVVEGLPVGPEAGSVHGRIGIFAHSAGDNEKAAEHLERSRGLLARGRGARWVRERLRAASELAEIASNRGDYPRAEEICRGGLEEIARLRRGADRGIRREEMVLLETLGHLQLRRFRYPEARDLLEKSLGIAGELGSVPEEALILNNLGILHIQENRFREALGCYERAERRSARIGDDQALVNIASNLALLHAKMGDPEAADLALERAARHDARCDSSRTRLLRLHIAGLVDLCLGRHGAGIETLREAIRLGRELADPYLETFDLVYLGECHLFRGEWKAAAAAFAEASRRRPAPPPIESLVAARSAALAALRGDSREARAICDRAAAAGPGIGQLDAWNRVFLGWAERLLRRHDAAAAHLEPARAFFQASEVPGGEIHAALELAAVDIDRGEPAAARERLDGLRERFEPGRGALKSPLLAARLLALEARILVEGGGDTARARSLLLEAESHLIGHRLRDLESLVRELKERLRPARSAGGPPAGRGEAIEEAESEGAAPPAARRGAEVPRAGSIAGESAAIRELRRLVISVARSSLPVLISGETGTGKEVVARAIHGESPRRAGPFLAIGPASLPPELLEAELFGFRAGSFTGADRDRAGLLAAARGGTFLFDEIGEMPLAVQGKILRAIERGEVRPLGAIEEVGIDVRFLFTTSRDPRDLVEKGVLRRDLFFRASAIEVAVPPLRERPEDIPALLELFAEREGDEEPGREPLLFDDGAREALAAHPWPGNVRELENLVRRLALTRGGTITAADLAPLIGSPRPRSLFPPSLLRGRSLDELLVELEREYLIGLGAERGGDVRAVAEALGITERALFKRLRKLGLRLRDLRPASDAGRKSS